MLLCRIECDMSSIDKNIIDEYQKECQKEYSNIRFRKPLDTFLGLFETEEQFKIFSKTWENSHYPIKDVEHQTINIGEEFNFCDIVFIDEKLKAILQWIDMHFNTYFICQLKMNDIVPHDFKKTYNIRIKRKFEILE